MRIHRVRGFLAYSHIIETDRALFLFDAGFVGQGTAIIERIRQLGRSPEEIVLAVVSHGHVDHYGGIPRLQQVADFDVLVHPMHAERVAEGAGAEISPGIPLWAKGYERVANVTMPRMDNPPIDNVVAVEDRMRLDEYGWPATVLFTPGHSEGDISVLADTGDCFVGDIVQGARMRFLRPELPAMALDTDAVLRSWELVLDEGAEKIWPAHGAPASASTVRRSWRKLVRAEA